MRAYSPDRDHKNKDDSMSYNGSANSLNKYHRSPYLQSNHHELQQNSQMVIVCPKNTKNKKILLNTIQRKNQISWLIIPKKKLIVFDQNQIFPLLMTTKRKKLNCQNCNLKPTQEHKIIQVHNLLEHRTINSISFCHSRNNNQEEKTSSHYNHLPHALHH